MSRKTRRRKGTGYSDQHRKILLEGRAFFTDKAKDFYTDAAIIGRPAYNMPVVQAAWDELRGELLPKYIQDHPGRRPWAWWKFDAPAPRRRCLTGNDPYDDPNLPKWAALNFGICQVFSSPDPVDWETEAAYLDRHNLLTQIEANR